MLNNIKLLQEKLNKAISQLSYFPRTFSLVWGATRGWTLGWLALLAVDGLLPATWVYLSRLLVDDLVVVINSGGTGAAIKPVLYSASAMFGVLLMTELFQSAGNWIRAIQAELIQDKLYRLIHEKSVSVDMAFYESPDYYDQLNRAREDAGERSLTLIESTGSLLQSGITLAAMAALLVPYGFWLPVILALSTIPAFHVVLRHSLHYHNWWKRTTADRRRTHYYDAVLTYDEFAAELRLFNLGPHFREHFTRIRDQLRRGRLTLVRNESLARLGAGALAVVVSGGCITWMGWRAFQGLATLGDLALFYQAFNRGQSLLRSLLTHLGDIYANSLFLGNLFEFLGLESSIKTPVDPIPCPQSVNQGIRFENVTFLYPGSQNAALRDFNLEIPTGQVVAVVGANGAGKSTLVKLLCRLYDPNKGRILLDECDIRQMSLQELRRMITIMFQKPVQYYTSAEKNIALGTIDTSPYSKAIEDAARAAGAHEIITRLPEGYKTLLGKWFVDGTELSGGEWQRIALARAFLRKAPIVILDEPTSFMDSWAESEWLKRFRKLVQGQTAIIITHRFTTAMLADVIHVMDKGQIVESGSHHDLLAQKGRYAESWKNQIGGQSTRGKSA